MSGEYQIRWPETGVTLYACLVDTTGKWWNGSVFETFTVANWTNYDIALNETPASSYFYVGTHPATQIGTFAVLIFKRLGGSPAITDYLAGSGDISWSGTEEIDFGTIDGDVADISTDQNKVLNVYDEIPKLQPILQIFG